MSRSQVNVRVPPEVKAWLAARAEANCRTINGEILALLKDAKAGEDQNKVACKPKKQ